MPRLSVPTIYFLLKKCFPSGILEFWYMLDRDSNELPLSRNITRVATFSLLWDPSWEGEHKQARIWTLPNYTCPIPL